MAAEISGENIDRPEVLKRPSTAGMTTRVVKSSLWTLLGQVAPLFVSLVTTPFTIRLLGAEGYGVFVLIGLIPTYLSFADFGMSMASTKFGSEAYAEGDQEKEANVVRTAAFIALCSSLPVAAGLMIFAPRIVGLFSVPEHLFADAVFALRLAAITFVVNFLCGIFNTPQLARLRMDLNTAINTIPRMLGLIATPIVIYLGYGIVGAVTVLLAASILNLTGHLIVSGRLVRCLFRFGYDQEAVPKLLKYGGGWLAAMISGAVLSHSEKLVLARSSSIENLAHYSVAFTFASMSTLFVSSLQQSLIPGFAQILGDDKREQLYSLYALSLRIGVIIMLPVLMTGLVVAEPFFTVWAGEEFGRKSTIPFFFLLFGMFFSVVGCIPGSLVLASGRTDILAKLYWLQILPYLMLVFFLAKNFEAEGAAIAWSLRVAADALLIVFIAKKIHLIPNMFKGLSIRFLAIATVFSPVFLLVLVFHSSLIWQIIILIVVSLCYIGMVWRILLLDEEKNLIKLRIIRRIF